MGKNKANNDNLEENMKEVMKPRRKKRNSSSHSNYIYNISKRVNPNLGMTKKAVHVLDSLLKDIQEKLEAEAASMARDKGVLTLSSRQTECAIKIHFKGHELADKAIRLGNQSIVNYRNTK